MGNTLIKIRVLLKRVKHMRVLINSNRPSMNSNSDLRLDTDLMIFIENQKPWFGLHEDRFFLYRPQKICEEDIKPLLLQDILTFEIPSEQ